MTELESLKIIVEKLTLRIEELEKENKELRARLGMNSTNSSMPPSSDMFKKKDKKTKSLRQKSDKSSGGQIGHAGNSLKKVESPDVVIDIPHTHCEHCNSDIKKTSIDAIKTRQVFDIPKIQILATEYRVHSKTCPHCNKKSKSQFPKNVTHETQYGENIKSLITNLNVYQALPYKRIKELLSQIFNVKLSEGTIFNTLKKAFKVLEPVEELIKEELRKTDILHADETGSNVNGVNQWIHSASNNKYTVLFPHRSRGKKAILEANVLPLFKGILVRDCWAAYNTFNHFQNALCCAHLLRELNSIEENSEFQFPKKIKELLLEMKSLVESGKEIDTELENLYYFRFLWAIESGFKEESIANPFNSVISENRRRSKAYNLLLRLNRIEDVLRFFTERNADIFTNNLAERDIRNIKIKNKVSGLFRSKKGIEFHCRIRAYISTVMKNNLNVHASLKSIFSLDETIVPIIP